MIPWFATMVAVYCALRLLQMATEKSDSSKEKPELLWTLLCFAGVAAVTFCCFKIHQLADNYSDEMRNQDIFKDIRRPVPVPGQPPRG